MSEYKKGFDDAIERVLFYCNKQAQDYAKLDRESHCTCKRWSDKALAIVDFRLYLEQLYQQHVLESGS